MLLHKVQNYRFRICITCVLSKYLPKRTKRLIFIASLTARLKGMEMLDVILLHKLNKLMNLCNTEAALKLPISLSKAIWHGMTPREIFNQDVNNICTNDVAAINRMSIHVVSVMPEWLKYADTSVVIKDIKELLYNCNILQST